jgi:hypothetical protein
METFLALVVLVNAWMTIGLWQTVRRGPKRKFLTALREGKPIQPQHQRPPEPDALPPRHVNDEYRRFFADFEAFADFLNGEFESSDNPWRLQELSNSETSSSYEYPVYGRRYEVFYNQFKVGLLEISPSHEYSETNPKVSTAIELNYARILHFGSIRELVDWISTYTAFGNREEREKAMFLLVEAAVNRLWRHEYDPDIDDRNSGGSINVWFDGSASTYLKWWRDYGSRQSKKL